MIRCRTRLFCTLSHIWNKIKQSDLLYSGALSRFISSLVMVLPELHLGGSALNHAERHRDAYSGKLRSAWAIP